MLASVWQVVVVRLTDERDMVFLYHMRMTEEEYRWSVVYFHFHFHFAFVVFVTYNVSLCST